MASQLTTSVELGNSLVLTSTVKVSKKPGDIPLCNSPGRPCALDTITSLPSLLDFFLVAKELQKKDRQETPGCYRRSLYYGGCHLCGMKAEKFKGQGFDDESVAVNYQIFSCPSYRRRSRAESLKDTE
jgi:hypothetical protein